VLLDSLVKLLVDQKLRATNAHAIQDIKDVLEELNEINRPCKLVVAKMAGAVVIGLTAGAARLAILQNTHAGIKQSTNFRFGALIDRMRRNFHHGTTFNLFGAEDSKLNTNNGFNFGTRSYESSGHLLFFLVGILNGKL